ncbi:Outer membrane porin protein [Cupriavidus laharis]|uniref:Outer membrane porin protein n=1 Tax=Cupriavidus laharis TaxID=151654 RepID=A0ABN7ZI96_9BURK|nr:porin [Cupriavidus laharis]CAG9183824.1 Outer membrane porin protein [Cupriavidus laharis]
MKRSIFASAVLGLFTCAAQAQSNVTLYGVLDTNLEYVSNMSSTVPSATNGFRPGEANNVFRMTPGGLSGSRWGLRGIEDLGGGLKAMFALENGFSSDDGRIQQGGRLFGRQAFVGLELARAGRVTFGRQYTSMFEALANFSPNAFGNQYEPIIALAGANFRSDNLAKYTNKYGPVSMTAHWSFGNGVAGGGEVPGEFRRDTGYGAGVGYAAGPFATAIGYDQYNPTLSTGGTGTFKKAAMAASYATGPVKVMAGFRWGRNIAANDNTILRDNLYWIGTNYQATSALSLTLAYYYDDVKNLNLAANGATNNIANPWQVLFVADYNLSKRTDIYLSTAYAKNAGLNFDTSAISFANGYFPGAGESSMVGVALGVRHKF